VNRRHRHSRQRTYDVAQYRITPEAMDFVREMLSTDPEARAFAGQLLADGSGLGERSLLARLLREATEP
jgi:hypothetical protein